MYSFCAGGYSGGNNGISIQIAFSRWRRAYAYRLISHGDVIAIGICIRIDSNSFNIHGFGRTHNPAGNFATISNEDFVKHCFLLAIYNGRLSCLRCGRSARLPFSIFSARASRNRELFGMITSSI